MELAGKAPAKAAKAAAKAPAKAAAKAPAKAAAKGAAHHAAAEGAAHHAAGAAHGSSEHFTNFIHWTTAQKFTFLFLGPCTTLVTGVWLLNTVGPGVGVGFGAFLALMDAVWLHVGFN